MERLEERLYERLDEGLEKLLEKLLDDVEVLLEGSTSDAPLVVDDDAVVDGVDEALTLPLEVLHFAAAANAVADATVITLVFASNESFEVDLDLWRSHSMNHVVVVVVAC